MATLTVRKLDDPLKTRLRLRAAAHNRSMEEEARQILKAALQEPTPPLSDLGARIRARFKGLGDMPVPVQPRERVREIPDLSAPAPGPRAARRKPAPPSGRRG